MSAKLKSERHHWWPECVSRLWADEAGGVHWLHPNGEDTHSKPKNFGLIKNGHHIKFTGDSSAPSPWDVSFESTFQSADSNFPDVIKWLYRLHRAPILGEQPIASRITGQACTDEQFSQLIECIVSLVVRSPMHRETVVRSAEQLLGSIESRNRNALIGLNMRHSMRDVLKRVAGRGKAMVVFSPYREFIFGDGFFNNLPASIDYPVYLKLFVPLTPRIAILFVRPASFIELPRLVTFVASGKETEALNCAVQIYARQAIYYRMDRPVIIDGFAQNKHLVFSDLHNPVDQLILHIPGITPK